MRETLSNQGLQPVTSTPEQFAALIQHDLARWAKVIRTAGITANEQHQENPHAFISIKHSSGLVADAALSHRRRADAPTSSFPRRTAIRARRWSRDIPQPGATRQSGL
jgi:hypothetical protein